MKRTLEALACLALFLALCALGAVTVLGFCGYFD